MPSAQPDAVVILVNEGCHVRAQMLEIPIGGCVDLLSLQRFQEALATGIVIGIRWPAHTRDHLVLTK
jgi:hypothetical protein